MIKNLRNKIKTSPRAGEVGAPLRVRGTREQTVGICLRLFSSALNVILRRERSELSGESRNIMALSLNRMHHPGSSANELTLKAKDDESGVC